MSILTANYSDINHDEMAQKIGLKAKHIPILVTSFLEESAAILEKLQTSIESTNYQDIKSQAHSIKGSAGNLHFNEVYEMSKEIELSASQAKKDFDYQAHLDAIKKAVATISF
ncbi:Hpt domain-containing protein [Sulfurimonas sp.]|uniref:Hpt domain-containing protein n=1 Tax=Sulfurimonas sp. TaxID=2022749 RepID=UPI002B470CFF|nr:Hpt domain-containing protein [Sulfurimonas sp.]